MPLQTKSKLPLSLEAYLSLSKDEICLPPTLKLQNMEKKV